MAASAASASSAASVVAVSASSIASLNSASAKSASLIANSGSVASSTSSATVSTTSTTSPLAAGGSSSSTSTTSSLSSITSTATQSTSSRSVTKARITQSTTTAPSSSKSSTAAPHQSGVTSSNNRLSNGVVAGIVVAVAIGLAFLTFLATYLIMRRQQHSKGKRSSRSLRDSRGLELRAPRHQDPIETPKNAFVAETSSPSETYEKYISQSADDDTIKQKAKSTLDQIELHIENFYRNSSSSALRPDDAGLAVFNSPFLPAALASLLPRSKNRVNIMKHALAQSVTSSISPSASSAQSLLPAEYALLPNTVMSARSSVSTKAGFTQIMSRWRIMTAYLRPDPTKDAAYIAYRDGQIRDTVQSFAKAFAPWKNTGYKDEERTRSLSAILEDAANLGILLFSQPSTLKFHWPTSSEVRPGKIVVSPALMKITDEKGGELVKAQVMVDQVVLDA